MSELGSDKPEISTTPGFDRYDYAAICAHPLPGGGQRYCPSSLLGWAAPTAEASPAPVNKAEVTEACRAW